MQDGGHIAPGANENIIFLIAYTISFPKIYSLYTFQKNVTEILTKTCFKAAILKNARWRPYWTRGKLKQCFLIAYTISFSKMYSFHTLQKIPTKLHSEPDYK